MKRESFIACMFFFFSSFEQTVLEKTSLALGIQCLSKGQTEKDRLPDLSFFYFSVLNTLFTANGMLGLSKSNGALCTEIGLAGAPFTVVNATQ